MSSKRVVGWPGALSCEDKTKCICCVALRTPAGEECKQWQQWGKQWRANKLCVDKWLPLLPLQIGPEGAIALAAALKVNPVLSYLNLSGTTIGGLRCTDT